MMITTLDKLNDESDFQYKLRLCHAKLENNIQATWEQITKAVGESSAENLRHKAYAYEELLNYQNMNNGEKITRILSLSDFHIPFNLPASTFKQWENKIDILVLNGDIEDCQSCSHFPKLYRINLDEEMVLTRNYIRDLVEIIKPEKVYITKGNHEHRLGKYLSDRLHEDLLSLTPNTPLDLILNDGFTVKDRINKTAIYYSPLSEYYKDSEVSIQYDDNWWCKIGKTIFAHPLSYCQGMLRTTEKAWKYFESIDKDFDSIVLGHTHKLGSYIQGNVQMYEQGCCCDLSKIDYADGYLTIPNQNGYLYLCQDINGKCLAEKTRLVKI